MRVVENILSDKSYEFQKNLLWIGTMMKTTKTPMRPAQRISFHKMYVDIAVNIGDTHNECITTVKLNVKFHIKTHVLNTI